MRRSVTGHTPLAASTLLVFAVALAACSPAATAAPSESAAPSTTAAAPASSAPAAAPSSPATGGSTVSIKNFAFAPASLSVAVGTTVTWTNNDTTGHTVTADDGSFDSKTLANGATFSQTFSKAGTYAYHCAIHRSMTATIVVQ